MSHSPQFSSETPSNGVSKIPSNKALVLGGGGSAGNAWLIGVVAGLCEGGVDVTEADVVIGTSAGSTAAAQITSADPADLLADILSTTPPRRNAPAGSRGAAPTGPPTNQMETTGAIIAAAEDAADMRRRLGAWALESPASSDGSGERWRTTVAARLPSLSWPQRRVVITAVDALTGEPVAFERHSGVDLVDAVAASCASGFAYRIGDDGYIDGGYRTNADNADLAAGYDRVLVLSPFGGRARTPVEWGLHLSTQVAQLRAQGSHVETIFPDSSSVTAFGDNMMDLSRRPPAARAGYEQGSALAEQLADF